jgi:hypothetical protein
VAVRVTTVCRFRRGWLRRAVAVTTVAVAGVVMVVVV